MKVVLDTNVIVSGFLNPFGAPGALVRFVASGDLPLLYDARLLLEYREVLLRPKFGFEAAAVDDFLSQVEADGDIVSAAPLLGHLTDRSDEPFLEVALSGRADALVKGNMKHFPQRLCGGLPILPPAEFLRLFSKLS